jgi:predicted MFS family arabinose efflux permease
MPSFQRDFKYTESERKHVNSLCVSILQAGAFVGCFAVWPVAARFGRRVAFMAASAVFCVGAIMQVVVSGSLSLFYVGRVVSGEFTVSFFVVRRKYSDMSPVITPPYHSGAGLAIICGASLYGNSLLTGVCR